ncbi:MAG: phosphonate ABC transporter, permease protein PhnE [Dehalococcoidia bacterium]
MTSRQITGRVAFLAVVAAFVVSLYRLELLDPSVVWPALQRLGEFVTELFPPNWDVTRTLLGAMGETLQIAFAGTLLGFLFSLPLAILATRTLFGGTVTTAARLVMGAVRTVPSLLWGVIFVIGFGLGPAAGALGVALYTVGYMGKLLYEAFEAADAEVVEAVRSVSANRLQLFAFAVLPESANALISQLLFMFEYNIRASSIMGFVGAGGIGYYMLGYIQLLQYENLMTALIITFVVVMAIDYLSVRLRSLILSPSPASAPSPFAGLVPSVG